MFEPRWDGVEVVKCATERTNLISKEFTGVQLGVWKIQRFRRNAFSALFLFFKYFLAFF